MKWRRYQQQFVNHIKGIDMARSVTIAFSCDAWHSHASKEIVGVFSTKKIALKNLKKFLDREDLYDLEQHNQTQGRETNYILESYTINATDYD